MHRETHQIAVLASLDTPPTDALVPLFVQFGFKRGFRGGQVVNVEVGGAPVNKNAAGIKFISNPAKRSTECWWAGNIEVSPGITVQLVTRVGVTGAGADTERSTDQTFIVDPDYNMREIEVNGVGMDGGKRFPLLKGTLRPVSQRTQHESTLASVDAMLDSLDEK